VTYFIVTFSTCPTPNEKMEAKPNWSSPMNYVGFMKIIWVSICVT